MVFHFSILFYFLTIKIFCFSFSTCQGILVTGFVFLMFKVQLLLSRGLFISHRCSVFLLLRFLKMWMTMVIHWLFILSYHGIRHPCGCCLYFLKIVFLRSRENLPLSTSGLLVYGHIYILNKFGLSFVELVKLGGFNMDDRYFFWL